MKRVKHPGSFAPNEAPIPSEAVLTAHMTVAYAGGDYSLVRHGDEVGRASVEVAGLLFASSSGERHRRLADIGGRFHDVGKIYIPERLRLSRRLFSHSERKEMERHCHFGADLLTRHEFPREVIEVAACHHLWFGGGGYGGGEFQPAGHDIPVLARIVAVTDYFVARTEWRPYRKPESPSVVGRDMRALRGRQFDPVILDAFFETNFFKTAVHPRGKGKSA